MEVNFPKLIIILARNQNWIIKVKFSSITNWSNLLPMGLPINNFFNAITKNVFCRKVNPAIKDINNEVFSASC